MKRNEDKLKHALHNELVCNYLALQTDFPDWIITSAFYTSLHFISYKVFPFEAPSIEGGKTKIECIDDFMRYKGDKRLSKHELLSNLASKKCKDISEDYDWLLNMSMTARYTNYYQSIPVANKAISIMKKIKKYCIA